MVRHLSLLCSSAPSLLQLGPMDCHPSSLLSGLILWPAIPHRFAQALSLFFGSVHGRGAARSMTVKNHRRACMEVLIKGGEYFSEDAMREREPYLHHLFLGRFQDPSGRAMSRPGEQWSETLMQRCKEAMLVEKIQEE